MSNILCSGSRLLFVGSVSFYVFFSRFRRSIYVSIDLPFCHIPLRSHVVLLSPYRTAFRHEHAKRDGVERVPLQSRGLRDRVCLRADFLRFDDVFLPAWHPRFMSKKALYWVVRLS